MIPHNKFWWVSNIHNRTVSVSIFWFFHIKILNLTFILTKSYSFSLDMLYHINMEHNPLLLYPVFKKLLSDWQLSSSFTWTWHMDTWQAKWAWVNQQIVIAHLEDSAGPGTSEKTAGLTQGALIIRGLMYHIVLSSLQLFRVLTPWPFDTVESLPFISWHFHFLIALLIICKSTAAQKVIVNPIQNIYPPPFFATCKWYPPRVSYAPLGDKHKILLGH